MAEAAPAPSVRAAPVVAPLPHPQPTASRLLWFLRVLRAFTRREMIELASYRAWVVTQVVTFGLATVSLVFFSRFIGSAENPHLARYGGDYLAFGLVGILIAELQHVGVSALSQRVRLAQVMGYLEAQMATPAPPWIVLGVAPVYEFGAAALRSAVYLLGAALVLGVRFADAHLASLALTVPLVLAAFGGLGLLTAGTTMLARRFNPVATILTASSVFVSGVVYPTSVLPGWLQSAGKILPLTHALEAMRRALLIGATPQQLAPSLVALALFAVILTPVGLGTFVYALRRAREDGSLTHY